MQHNVLYIFTHYKNFQKQYRRVFITIDMVLPVFVLTAIIPQIIRIFTISQTHAWFSALFSCTFFLTN